MDEDTTGTKTDPRSTGPLQVGEWTVHPALHRLSASDRTVHLEPRVMHVLVCLAARPAELVTREALLDAVWGDTVVSDEALTVTVSDLRRALGDDPRTPRYIETIRKGGYRLIATVGEATTPEEGAAAPARSGAPRRRTPTTPGRAWIGAAALAALILVATLWLARERPAGTPRPHFLATTPITSLPGREVFPAISADGTRIAFAWNGEHGESYDIYIVQRDTATPLRLTDHDAHELYPTWSPDASTIAFYRGGPERGIYMVAAAGGPAELLIATEFAVEGMDWSPDGRWIAYSARPSEEIYAQLHLVSVDTRERRHFTDPAPQYASAIDPVFSPDGDTIAFVRSSAAYRQDIYLAPLTGGQPLRRLTQSQRQIYGITWTADGTGIVFAGAPAASARLWRISVADGSIGWIPTTHLATRPSIARTAGHLVFQETTLDRNIWRGSLVGAAGQRAAPAPLVTSTRNDFAARLSPDGTRLAFLSDRTGTTELWICEADGSGPRRLTDLAADHMTAPCWSPDGSRVAFSATPGGGLQDGDGWSNVYVVDAAGGIPQPVVTPPRHQVLTGWSRDGEWLYVDVDRRDGWDVWRVRADGTRTDALIKNAYGVIHETRDGHALYHSRGDEPGLWRWPLDGTEPTCLVEGSVMARWIDWAAVDGGIYYVHQGRDGNVVAYYEFATGERESLATVPARGGRNLSVDPDAGMVLFDVSERIESDLYLVEDFR